MPKYRVSGPHRVFEHEPGTEFEAEIPAAQEQRLLAGGHIERVRRPVAPVAATKESKEEK